MKFTEEQKQEIRKFFSNEVSVDLFESDLDKLESLIFNNNSIPIEPPVMQKIAKIYPAKITISRATSNVEDDYITMDIAMDKKHIRVRMSMVDYGNAISGLARQPIDIEFDSNFSA